jgi:hypothetical protein
MSEQDPAIAVAVEAYFKEARRDGPQTFSSALTAALTAYEAAQWRPAADALFDLLLRDNAVQPNDKP